MSNWTPDRRARAEGRWTSRARVSGRTVSSSTVGTFRHCVFEGSTLVYFGGQIPHMEQCDMRGVKFEFGGPARNTVQLLGWLRTQNMIA